MKNSAFALRLVAAAGAVVSVSGLASAALPPGVQPSNNVVVISGATLQQNLINAPAATNDFFDVDGNGVCLSCPGNGLQQLAPAGLPPSGSQFLNVIYRAVGSVNGLQELVDFGRTFATTGGSNGGQLRILGVSDGRHNRVAYITNGVTVVAGLPNTGNPGATPIRSDLTTLAATYAAAPTPAAGGIRIDIAPLDVPVTQAIQYPGASAYNRLPGQAGYGTNSVLALNTDGTTYALSGVPQDYKMVDTTAGGVSVASLLADPSLADANTIFETFFVYAPVAVVTNLGTGLKQIERSELAHLFTTGRASSGENLMFVTRDAGSGTHNAVATSVGIDPSFGVGERVGNLNAVGNNQLAGPIYLPGNQPGSGNLETAVRNNRLAIGYTGAERGATSWLVNGQLELLAVQNAPGGLYYRPTMNNLTDNYDAADPSNPIGYRIGGAGVFATFGDPRAAVQSLGGDNPDCPCAADFDLSGGTPDAGDIDAFFVQWLAGDASADVDCSGGTPDAGDIDQFFVQWLAGGCPGNANPALRNPAASAYLNNITRSIEAYEAFPGADQNVFSPGEFVAARYLPLNAPKALPSRFDPSNYVANPDFDLALYNTVRNPAAPPTGSGSVLTQAQYATFGFALANFSGGARPPSGVVPTRLTGNSYSDGTTGATTSYRRLNATTINYGAAMPARNAIAGDFNGDYLRNWNDIPELVAAARFRAGTNPTWIPLSAPNLTDSFGNSFAAPGTDLIPELLGDFNSDGNFNSADVRYFADGLAKDPVSGKLNRREGFIRVDAAAPAGNFFGVTTPYSTGATYQNGDARADIAGNLVTPNFAPIGSDSKIDAKDINYVYNQFKNNPNAVGGQIDWAVTAQAVGADLSADITGDLKIGQADVCAIVAILGTNAGDVNLDGVTNAADLAIINSGALGRSTSDGKAHWEQGDLNGDGKIDAADVAIFNAPATLCP